MAARRARPFTSSIKAACSGLTALLLLSLLCLVQSEATASTNIVAGGASISLARQGDAVALLRITGKIQAVDIRTGRLAPAKFASGDPGALPPEAALLLHDRITPILAMEEPATLPAPRASTNQPRAPPSI